MKYALGLIAVIGLTACDNSWYKGETAHVYIEEKDFTPAQISLIKEAITNWDTALHGYIHFEYVNGKGSNDLIVIRGESIQTIRSKYPEGDAVTMILPWEHGGGINLPNNDDQEFHDYYLAVTEHEIGHAIGLNHRLGHVLMNHIIWSKNEKITCDDLIQFCEYNDCYYKDFPICQ